MFEAKNTRPEVRQQVPAAQAVFGCSCAGASLYQGGDCHWAIVKRKMVLSRPAGIAGAGALEREKSAFSTPQA
jgi:hypothetical protein